MIVQVRYGEVSPDTTPPGRPGYAFKAPEGAQIGDRLYDGLQAVTVVGIGRMGYDGPVRALSGAPAHSFAAWS